MITILFDTETTGLTKPSSADLKDQPHIIELGAARVENGVVTATLSELINPGVPLEALITKITGLTDEQLHDKPPFADRLPALREIFTGAQALVAHNAPFDSAMLRIELQRLNVTDFPWPAETICTVQEFVHVKGHRLKLTELYEHFVGKPLLQTHRALDDVLAMYEALTAAHFWETVA